MPEGDIGNFSSIGDALRREIEIFFRSHPRATKWRLLCSVRPIIPTQ